MTTPERPGLRNRNERAAQAFLDSGLVTRETHTLIKDCVRDAVQRHNFPRPDGREGWDTDLIEETDQDFCSTPGKTIAQRLTQMAVQSVGVGDFLAQLRTSVANHIRSGLRRSRRGRLAATLRGLLRQTDAIVESTTDHFALRATIAATSADWTVHDGPLRNLVRAAWAVEDVKTIRWRADSTNDPPIAERADLRRICLAVLAAANGPMHLNTLVEVFAHRFELRDAPDVVDIDDVAEHLAGLGLDAAVDTASREDALAIWNQMTTRDRQIFPLLDESARDIGLRLGISKSSAAVHIGQCRELLRRLLPAERAEGEQVLRHLGWLSRVTLPDT